MNKQRKSVQILGINQFSLSIRVQLAKNLQKILTGQGRARQIATVNPEFLLAAQNDQEFFYLLNHHTLNVVDGFGLQLAGWCKGQNLPRWSGADLTDFLLTTAQTLNLPVAIINWSGGLSTNAEIATAMSVRYPQLASLTLEAADKEGAGVDWQQLNLWRPSLLLVNFGAPAQEKFLYRHLPQLPSVRLALGIGGALDFWTGKIKRAPAILRHCGLEWLWRLAQQPQTRLKRIWRAVVVFIWEFLWQELVNRWLYRPNVVMMLINPRNELLLLDAAHKHYWSLPQGGVEAGETWLAAAKRELEEETGLTDFTILGQFVNIYKYRWRRNHTVRGYKGQKQTLIIVACRQVRPLIKLNPYEHQNYRWVARERLLSSADQIHHQAYSLFLKCLAKIEAKRAN